MLNNWVQRLTLGVACVALFAALGGPSYAAKKIRGSQIASNAITSGKVKDGSLLSKDFSSGQLPAGPKGDKGNTGEKGTTGNTGADGTARAYAIVDKGSNCGIGGTCLIPHSKGISNVTYIGTAGNIGRFCVTAPGISPDVVTPVVSPEVGNSTDPGFGQVEVFGSHTQCPGAFEVITYRLTTLPPDGELFANPSSAVAFTIIIP